MADLSLTAANVIAGANSKKEACIWAAAVTAGQVVYKDEATGKWNLADADSATAAVRGSGDLGIALSGGANNQPGFVHTFGDITIGATVVAGAEYVLSDTPGGIMPRADLETGDYVVSLGNTISTTVLAFDPKYTAVVTA